MQRIKEGLAIAKANGRFKGTKPKLNERQTKKRARSLNWCRVPDPARTGSTGWSRCFIPASQNLSAGGILGGFYSNERMLDGDLFQVAELP